MRPAAPGRPLRPRPDQARRLTISVTGSTSAKKVKDNYANTVQLQEYDTYSKCVEALNSGSIDGVTTDNVILAGFAAQDQYKDKLKVVGKPFSEERYGVGIKKGDTQMVDFVNGVFKDLKDDGTWAKLHEQWIGKYTGEKGEVPTITVPEAVELVKQNQ